MTQQRFSPGSKRALSRSGAMASTNPHSREWFSTDTCHIPVEALHLAALHNGQMD